MIKAEITALEWDYRTELAAQCCQNAFAKLSTAEDASGQLIGFAQDVRVTRDFIQPFSDYTILTQQETGSGSQRLDLMTPEDFTLVSRAVLASHEGNQDSLLYSRMQRLTELGPSMDGELRLRRTVLRDMLIYTPSEAWNYQETRKAQPRKRGARKVETYPGLVVVVVPPVISQHERIRQMEQISRLSLIASSAFEIFDVELQLPSTIHPE